MSAETISGLNQAAPRLVPTEFVSDEAAVERLAFRWGEYYDSYLATEPDREYFWNRDHTAYIAYVPRRRHLIVVGGVMGSPVNRACLLAEFVERLRERREIATFCNIGDAELPMYRDLGFEVTKWGEDAIIDLEGWTGSGKPYEWMRRQTNYCLRHGLVFEECIPENMPEQEWRKTAAELQEIFRLDLETKPQSRPLQVLNGGFDPWRLQRRRVFVGRSSGENRRIEGFLICHPGRNGKFYSIESYRHRPDAVRGTTAFLMHQVILQFQSERVEQVSLCLMPRIRCEQKLPDDSRLMRWSLNACHRFLSFIFDSQGIYHFKSRFRPRAENRYLCVWPRSTIGSIWSLTSAWGMLRLHPGRTIKTLCNHTRKMWTRRKLAQPDQAE